MPITSLSQLDLSKQYSYADYLSWKIEERLELINGWVWQLATPNIAHQRISLRFTMALHEYLDSNKFQLLAAPTDVCLMNKNESDEEVKTVLQPDLLVVCDLEKLEENRIAGAPDLLVEILSPGNNHKEMNAKFDIYEENGVREYWIVYPGHQSVTVYIRNEVGKFIGLKPCSEQDILTSTIFPDLHVNLSELFEGISVD